MAVPASAVPRQVTRPSIRLRFVVERDGRVTRLEVLEPLLAEPPWPELQDSALEAVRQWRYEPPRCDGKPAAVCVTETVTVEVSGDGAASPRP